MREKREIIKDNKDFGGGGSSFLMLEVLLDIRSLLISMVKMGSLPEPHRSLGDKIKKAIMEK